MVACQEPLVTSNNLKCERFSVGAQSSCDSRCLAHSVTIHKSAHIGREVEKLRFKRSRRFYMIIKANIKSQITAIYGNHGFDF